MSADVPTDPAIESPADAAAATTLDPFGYVPTWISRIVGLGGEEPGTDPYYVFHTPYVDLGEGPNLFAIQFDDLVATSGTLTLRIQQVSVHPGSTASVADMTQANLRDLAVTGEPLVVRVVARPGMVYALWGTIFDDTDSRAAGLTVTLDHRGDDSPHAAKLADKRRSSFGAPSIRAVPQLVSADRASLAEPVSQLCTAAQMAEPVFLEWTSRLGLGAADGRRPWELAYILQALRRYGMLESGATGLGFGCGAEPLPAAMAAIGCTILATDRDETVSGVDALRHPRVCPDETFDANVAFRAVDMTAIPAELTDYDFTWSCDACEHLGSIAAGFQFIEDSIRCLKPGGLAVHTAAINLTSNTQTVEEGPQVLFRRKDFERLALRLISTGHEVAQIKFDAGDRGFGNAAEVLPEGMTVDDYDTTAFGLIIRRGMR